MPDAINIIQDADNLLIMQLTFSSMHRHIRPTGLQLCIRCAQLQANTSIIHVHIIS